MKREELAAIAPLLVPFVMAEIAKLVAKASLPSHYSTRRGHGPPGVPDKEWKRIAREIGRAPYPEGKGRPRARWLIVERERYESWLAAQSAGAAPTGPANDAGAAWTPTAALAAAGLRAQR